MDAYPAFAHGNAWAVPEALLCLCLLVVVVAARAQRRPKLILVLCQTLEYHMSGQPSKSVCMRRETFHGFGLQCQVVQIYFMKGDVICRARKYFNPAHVTDCISSLDQEMNQEPAS